MRLALLAFLSATALAAQVTLACAWPVTSKHYTFELDLSPTTLRNWAHRAQEAEAEIIGRFMDTFYDRYRAAGLPEAIIDRDDKGRMKVKLMYEDPPRYHGTYTRAIPGLFEVPILAEREIYISLNMKSYRSVGAEFFHTVAHEVFHSIQRAFPAGAAILDAGQANTGKEPLGEHLYDWLLEGSADAAGFIAAHGVAGFSNDPARNRENFRQKLAGLRSYSAPLHMAPIATFPPFPGLGSEEGYTRQTYQTSSFWRYLTWDNGGLSAYRTLFGGFLRQPVTPRGVVEWIHENIKRLPATSGGKRFPGGLPQAYAEFLAEFVDLPFITSYGRFTTSGNVFDEGTWQAMVLGKPGPTACAPVDLSPSTPLVTHTVLLQNFGGTCFVVSLAGQNTASAPLAFEMNVVASSSADEIYACQAVAIGSNGVTIRGTPAMPSSSNAQNCKRHAHILYAPRINMKRQSVVLSNVHAADGSGSVLGTRNVSVRVDFVLATASASGSMSPSQLSSPAPPPPPGAPATSPTGASTGRNISVNSTHARARGAQARHAPSQKQEDCKNWQPACPVIAIDLGEYDARVAMILGMGDSLGAGALVALDGAPRQLDILGTYGSPERLGAMAMELADTEFAEVSLRLRAPEGRLENGMRWDDAIVTAMVGRMAGEDKVDMHSRGPHPRPDACLSDPPATGRVEISEVGEGWIKGTFSADLFENYVQEAWKDKCATRPSIGRVSGTFIAPYEDVTQPPVDPAIAAYQAWAGLPAITWGLTDYGDLVDQAVATQRDILRDWQAERRPAEAGGGVGGSSHVACAQKCFPGVMGCPNISQSEVDRLTPIYLQTLPVDLRDMMRQQLENAPPQAVSHILAVGMNVDGCRDEKTRP